MGLLFPYSYHMRIFLYLILLVISCFTFSCAKGDLINDPQFGRISITDFTDKRVTVFQGEMQPFEATGTEYNLPSGKNRFRFYQNDILLLDTLLSVEPYHAHAFTMLKTDEESALRIFDPALNGFDNQILPDSGILKFSLANFSGKLPSKVNVYINTTTGSSKVIQAGQFMNVSTSFSPFQDVKLGFNQLSNPVNQFSMIIKNPLNQEILATMPLTLPTGNSSGQANALSATVFIIYISPANTATIFMQK